MGKVTKKKAPAKTPSGVSKKTKKKSASEAFKSTGFWLMKSEPIDYSITDLEKQKRPEPWDGVRNFTARNYMRHAMRVGDKAFFYHSNTGDPGVVGTMEIVSKPYPDPTAFDRSDKHYDPKSQRDDPRWWLVDVDFRSRFKNPVSLKTIKATPGLENMRLVRQGRLSVSPVTKEEWDIITSLSK